MKLYPGPNTSGRFKFRVSGERVIEVTQDEPVKLTASDSKNQGLMDQIQTYIDRGFLSTSETVAEDPAPATSDPIPDFGLPATK